MNNLLRKAKTLVALSGVIAALIFPACKKNPQGTGDRVQGAPAGSQPSAKTLYQCAMHPQIVSDRPGECPICHMKLVPIQSPAPKPEKKINYYRNPMDPSVTSPVPMKDSMGMDYIPVYSDDGQAPSASAHEPTVSGQAAIQLSGDVQQRIGVQLVEAQRRDLTLPIRAAARVAYDPQLYSAAVEHQEAVQFLARAQKEGSSGLEQAEATVRSSTLRLRQMGLSNGQIEQISSPSYDPSNLLAGSKTGKAWVYADVSDSQAAAIKIGQAVDLDSSALPGRRLSGTVQGIDPIVNAESRTIRVRILVPNTGGELRSGIFLNAVIHASLGKALAVPESAVLDTGTRQLVYVQNAPGSFQPRAVRIGRQAEGMIEIIEGLQAGEKVVSSANFLIDSESKIQAAAQEAR